MQIKNKTSSLTSTIIDNITSGIVGNFLKTNIKDNSELIEYCDTDGEVDAIIKIKENFYSFAYFSYIKEDGNIAKYYPDFLVGEWDCFFVETKANGV